MERTRPYWSQLSDEELIASRDEYREKAHRCDSDFEAELLRIADEMDDDLRLRAAAIASATGKEA